MFTKSVVLTVTVLLIVVAPDTSNVPPMIVFPLLLIINLSTVSSLILNVAFPVICPSNTELPQRSRTLLLSRLNKLGKKQYCILLYPS